MSHPYRTHVERVTESQARRTKELDSALAFDMAELNQIGMHAGGSATERMAVEQGKLKAMQKRNVAENRTRMEDRLAGEEEMKRANEADHFDRLTGGAYRTAHRTPAKRSRTRTFDYFG